MILKTKATRTSIYKHEKDGKRYQELTNTIPNIFEDKKKKKRHEIGNTHLRSSACSLCTARLGIGLLFVLTISRDVWVAWQTHGHLIRLWACSLLLSDWSFLEYTNGVSWCETALSLESDYSFSSGGCGKTLQLGSCSVLQQSKTKESHSTVQ